MLLGDDAESSDYDDFYADPEDWEPGDPCMECRERTCRGCGNCDNERCDDSVSHCANCSVELIEPSWCAECESIVCSDCGEEVPGCDLCNDPRDERPDARWCRYCKREPSSESSISRHHGGHQTGIASPWSGPLVATTQGDLPADLTDVVAELKSLRAEAKNLEVRQAELREVILERMGDQVDGKVDGRVVLKIVRGVRKSFDSKRFIKERPQEAIEYLSETETVTVRTL